MAETLLRDASHEYGETPEQFFARLGWIQVAARMRVKRPSLSRTAPEAVPVVARVCHGLWLADCECKGAMAVWVPGEAVSGQRSAISGQRSAVSGQLSAISGQPADSRQPTADSPQPTADSRQPTASSWFWCSSCANVDLGGMLRPVVFPDPVRRSRIEAALAHRPMANRNWSPGELIGALRNENLSHQLSAISHQQPTADSRQPTASEAERR